MNRRELFGVAAGVLLFARIPNALAQTYDLIIRGGRVIDPSIGLDGVRDVAIAGGRFSAVGRNRDALALKGKNTRVIRLGGKLVVPGFIDSHVHFVAGGFQLLALDLKNVRKEFDYFRMDC